MKTNDIIHIIGSCVIFLIGFISASVQTERDMRNEAIAAGVAKWEVNATNGVITFVYTKK